MEQNNDKIVIDLREIFGILKRKITKVLLVTALFVCAAGGYIFITPNQYECTIQLSLSKDNDNFFKTKSLLTPIAATYGKKDRKGHAPEIKDFVKKIKYTRPRNEAYLTIAVRDESPEVARKILDAIVSGGMEQYYQLKIGERQRQLDIYKGMVKNVTDPRAASGLLITIAGLENSVEALRNDIQVVDPAYCEEKPVAPRKVRITAVAMVLGLICGSMYVVLKEKL